MPEGPVVCDTGPLIALFLTDQLEVLPRLYPRVLAPRAVLEEVTAGGSSRPGADQIPRLEWIEVVEGVQPDPLLAAELGVGEAAVIAAAIQGSADVVLLDDRRARRIANRAYGLRVRGSAGVLVAAKRAGLLGEVRPLLEHLIREGYYLSPRVVERAAAEAGEGV
jgi:predicted nucleic acid-binding protein